MQRLLWISLLLLTGCQGVVGPFQHRQPRRVDDPGLTIPEQERLGRSRLALPQESATVAPSAGVDLPGPHGR